MVLVWPSRSWVALGKSLYFSQLWLVPQAVKEPVLNIRGDDLCETSLHFIYVTHTNASGTVPSAFQVLMHFMLLCLFEVNIVLVLIPPTINLRIKM